MKAHNIFKKGNVVFFSGKLTRISVILSIFESQVKRGGQKCEDKKIQEKKGLNIFLIFLVFINYIYFIFSL